MFKKTLSVALVLATSATLFACGKSDNTVPDKKKALTNHGDYVLYDFKDTVDNDKTKRTYTYIGEEGSFSLKYNILKDFSMTDFTCGTSLIVNNSYGYDRYMIVDTNGNEIAPYDKYTFLDKLGSKYYAFQTQKKGNLITGVIDEELKEIIPANYISVKLIPTDKAIFFACEKNDNIYDIYNEDGKYIIKDVLITNLEECKYLVGDYTDKGEGMLVIKGDFASLYSVNSGKQLFSYVEEIDESVYDSYSAEKFSGESGRYIFSNDGETASKIDEKFNDCFVFALNDTRYIYNENGELVAEYSDGGKLEDDYSDDEEKDIVKPFHSENVRALLIEDDDEYTIRNSNDKKVFNEDKEDVTDILLDTFGFIITTTDAQTIYDYNGDEIFKNAVGVDTFTLEDGSYYINSGNTLIKIGADETILFDKNTGIIAVSNTTSSKVYIKTAKETLSEYEIGDFESMSEEYGMTIVKAKGGIYSTKGTLLLSDSEE